MAHQPRKTVAILGAAIAGPTLSLQILSHPILRTRFRPILYDQSPLPHTSTSLPSPLAKNPPHSPPLPERLHRSGASVSLFANGLHPLFKLGLEDALRARGHEFNDLSIWNAGRDGSREMLNRQVNATWNKEMGCGVLFYEWAALRGILLERVHELGGEVEWGRKATTLEELSDGRVEVGFGDGHRQVADLVVGADGGFSRVRRHILDKKDPKMAAEVWMPHFMAVTGIYGVSAAAGEAQGAIQGTKAQPDDQHLIFLDGGFLSTGPVPEGGIRWDLVLREDSPPAYREKDEAGEVPEDIPANNNVEKKWMSTLAPSLYPPSSTLEVLRRHKDVFHPSTGRMEGLFSSAERIIRTPLRQRVWEEDEIQRGNVVLIGDASRLMMPTSGQGTGFAIEDATVLADSLLNHACPQETSSGEPAEASFRRALEHYARARVPRSKKMARGSEMSKAWSVGSNWLSRSLRYYGSKWSPGGDHKRFDTGNAWPFNGRFEVGK